MNLTYSIGMWLKYRRPRWLGSIINQLYNNEEMCMIQTKEIDYVSTNGCKYFPGPLMDSLVRRETIPLWFMGLEKEDIVLDIGAGIGSVCIPLAKECKKVYAVEPLFNRELSKNIELNGLKNIEVMPVGIGSLGEVKVLSFAGKSQPVSLITFSALLFVLKEAPPSFLKCDCEGEEWYINKSHLRGFRELRIEWHIRYDKEIEELKSIVEFLRSSGYRCIIWDGKHEPSPVFKKVYYMVASKRV